MTVVLMGNQNSGKSTLFRRLTGKKAHVGNYPGVTVGRTAALIKNTSDVLWDLPGTYSLNPVSADEEIAVKFLERADAVICVTDRSTLARGLLLILEIIGLNIPCICVLTKCKKDTKLEHSLEKALGIPVVTCDKNGICEIANAVKRRDFRNGVKLDDNKKFINGFIRENPYFFKASSISSLDRFILSSPLSKPLIILILLLIPTLSSLISDTLFSPFINLLFAGVQNIVYSIPLPHMTRAVTCDGIVPCLFALLEFLPTVVSVFFFLSLIEASGLLTRIALLFNGNADKLGVTGESVISLILGFGCTATAALSSRVEKDEGTRRRVCALLPFVPCSAKLPVLLFLFSLIFKSAPVLPVILFYLVSLFTGVILSLSPSRETVFYTELVPLRLPSHTEIFSAAVEKTSEFIRRVFSTLFLSMLFLWFLSHLSLNGTLVSPDSSILGFIGKYLSSLGLGDWRLIVALISGLGAKEAVISTLILLYGQPLQIPLASALPFSVFFLFYPPCITALVTISREAGLATAVKIFFRQLFIAASISLLVKIICPS